MRAVVQRVARACVRRRENEQILGSIERGLCVLLGIGQGDERKDADWLADKVGGLRIFADEGEGPEKKDMNRSLTEVGGAILLISQFTLYGDSSRGRRPSFTDALEPSAAEPLYEYFAERLRKAGHRVETGRFGAMMSVELVNDGPVTLWLDSATAAFRVSKIGAEAAK